MQKWCNSHSCQNMTWILSRPRAVLLYMSPVSPAVCPVVWLVLPGTCRRWLRSSPWKNLTGTCKCTYHLYNLYTICLLYNLIQYASCSDKSTANGYHIEAYTVRHTYIVLQFSTYHNCRNVCKYWLCIFWWNILHTESNYSWKVPEFSAEALCLRPLTLCAECFIRNYVSRVQKHLLPN